MHIIYYIIYSYRAKGFRVSVEEILVVGQRVVVAQLGDCLVGVAVSQPAQPSVWEPLQRPPQYLVLDAAHVYAHPPVECLGPHYYEWLRRQ